jgi:hypothetical protein
MKYYMVSCSLLLFLAGAALPCGAADWNFYGSARVATFYKDVETSGTAAKNYTQGLNSTARIGAKVQVSDTLAGRFEYGSSGGNASLRHLFGEWTFGVGKLLVGQTDTPLNFSLSKQAINNDHILNSYGHVDAKRKPMVRVSVGSFSIAAVQPETANLNVATPTKESKIPKIEAKYRFDMGRGFVDLAAGYQTYDLIDTATAFEYSVRSYILAIGGQLKAGAAYFNADAWMGQNVGPYDYNFSPDGNPTTSGRNLIDNQAWGMLVAVGYKLNDMVAFEAGYGHVQSELQVGGAGKDKAESYYVQSTITMAPGVFVVPELGRIDEMSNGSGARESDTTYFGAKWQIDF